MGHPENCLCGDCCFRKHLLDAPQRLAGAFFVFDEGEADVAVAVVAEAEAGGDGARGCSQP